MMGGKAQKKSDQSNYDRQKNFIYQALRELSPENISALTQQFLPHIMAGQFSLGQTALHGLARSQAIGGRFQGGFGASQRLGLQANLGNSALQQAFQQAFGLAGARAGAWTGHEPFQTQPNYNMAGGFQNAISSGLLGYALGGNRSAGGNNVPYYQPPPTAGYGLPPSYNPGTPLG